MKDIDRPKNLKRFYLLWQELNHAYEEYAKKHGLTYMSMFILQLISDGTTQKELCQTLYFSKQTISKVIQSFERKGLIELSNSGKDKRYKLIYVTEKGKQFQKEVIPALVDAELGAFFSLSEEEQETLTGLWERYTEACIKVINGKMDGKGKNE